jgi:flagellar basal body-associated protein FliL
MADEPAASEEKAPEAKPAPGLMATLIPALVVGLVLGGVGFALAYFVLPSRLQAATVTTTAVANGTNAVATPAAPVADASAPAAGAEKTKRSEADVASTGGKAVTKFTIEEVTVNIADTRGNRFVRAGVYFDADPAVLEELEANRARMTDALEQELSTKTLEELTSPDIRGNLRTELMGIINPTLKTGRVDNIYFTDLLVQ